MKLTYNKHMREYTSSDLDQPFNYMEEMRRIDETADYNQAVIKEVLRNQYLVLLVVYVLGMLAIWLPKLLN